MKLNLVRELNVLAVTIDESKDKKYFRISVFDDKLGEAGQVNCTENVAIGVKVGSINCIQFEYNDKYNSLRAVAVGKDVLK